MAQPDPGLLALVINDPLAPALLAAWKAERLTFAQLEEKPVLYSLVDVTQATSLAVLNSTIKRCRLAGLLLDGGKVSTLADSWLSAHVGRALGFKAKPEPKKGK